MNRKKPALLLIPLSGLIIISVILFANNYREASFIILLAANGFLLFLFVLYDKRNRKLYEAINGLIKESGETIDSITPDNIKNILSSYSSRLFQLEILKNKAESAQLQSQINPHFLYNTLDTIRGKATLDKSYEVANMIEILSRLFRYSIGEKREMLTIEDELSNIEDYLSIQRFRFGDRFDVLYDIDTNIKVLNYQVPKLLLQPIVENAINHGLEDMYSGGLIKIRIFHTETRLYINVIDNGKKAIPENIQKINDQLKSCNNQTQLYSDHGIALLNIQKRITYYFGEDYGIRLLLEADHGICAEVELPWEQTE